MHPFSSARSRITLLFTWDLNLNNSIFKANQPGSMKALHQLKTQLKGRSCWSRGVLSVILWPSFPFCGLRVSLSEEVSGRSGFIDSKPLDKGEVSEQFMKWLTFSQNCTIETPFPAVHMSFLPVLTHDWPPVFHLRSGCSVLSSYQLKLWCNLRDTSGVLAHSTHKGYIKGEAQEESFRDPSKNSWCLWGCNRRPEV